MARHFILLTLITLCSFFIYGQDQLPTSGFNGQLGGIHVMPEEFRVNLGSKDTKNDVEFYFLNYRTPVIDLRLLNKYTKYTLPESIVITPPDLSRFDHTTVLVGLYGDPKNPKMIIWLGGNYNYKNVTFFLDYDQDRNFTNDKGPIRMKEGEAPVSIVLTLEDGPQQLWLTVPKRQVKVKKVIRKIQNNFTLGFSAGAGSGELTYSDDNPDTFSNYTVNISEKHIGTNLSYYSRYFILGIDLSYQSHHFYASYDFHPSVTSPTSINPNQDLHSPNKVQLGLSGAIRIPFNNFLEFQPTIKYGQAHYLKPEYKKRRAADESYGLSASNFFEVGARLEFTVGIENAFFVEFAKNFQDWEPEVLADSDTFTSDLRITKFTVGYKTSIFSGRSSE